MIDLGIVADTLFSSIIRDITKKRTLYFRVKRVTGTIRAENLDRPPPGVSRTNCEICLHFQGAPG